MPLTLLMPKQPLRTISPINHTPFQPTPLKLMQYALCAWPPIPTTPESAALKHYEMAPKPGVEKMTMGDSSPQQAPPSAMTGTTKEDAPPPCMTSVMNAQDVATRITELRGVLELRKNQVLTLYNPDAWEQLLCRCNLLVKYQNLPCALQQGFDAGIHPIYNTFTLSNSPTLFTYSEAYKEIINKEFERGHYIGPCTCQEVESLISPFQSSPLSLIPKAGKPGKFQAIHNFSYLHTPTSTLSSINYTIDADMYPCTWGTFATICFTVSNLPPGSQASICDVAEAYQTIPIIPSQWPGLVVKLREEDSYTINTCNNFSLTSAGGIHGEVGDTTTDIIQAHGIGPLSKWVDNHIFFQIPAEHHELYNAKHQRWHAIITENGDHVQSGSRFWYKGEIMPNDLPAEFDENTAHPILDYSTSPNRSQADAIFTYCDTDIDIISEQLGIPWEPSKKIPFSACVPFLGFDWDLTNQIVMLTEKKKEKYKAAIRDWLSHPTHTLEETQKLYGKLLHASLTLPTGHTYLTNLETLLGSFQSKLFVLHHAP